MMIRLLVSGKFEEFPADSSQPTFRSHEAALGDAR
jgi:hypothetical protein